MKMYTKIARGKFKYPSHLSREAKSIIKELLQVVPTKRLGVVKGGAKLIKRHAWFKGFDWDKLLKKTLKAPIKIHVKNDLDTTNFDEVEDEDPVEPYIDDGTGWDADF